MTDEELAARVRVLGLEYAFAQFPEQLRAAAMLAAEEKVALGCVDDAGVEPA